MDIFSSYFKSILINFRVADFIDILIVAVFLYFIITWFSRQTSKSILVGIITLFIIFLLSRKYNLYLTSLFYQAGLTVILVALVVIFQQDIRRLFDRLSAWSFKKSRRNVDKIPGTVNVLVETVERLANERSGALIVIKGREPIENHTRGGIELNGAISMPLLLSIFDHNTPGHDGAVIIEEGQITKFGVHLPLSRNLKEVGRNGTRHTAGLGLAEVCDAEILIVSEEHGTITIAKMGKLIPVKSAVDLNERLRLFYKQTGYYQNKERRRNLLTDHWGVKVFSLCLSAFLWLMFAFKVETVQRTFEMPIEYRNIPDSILVDSDKPIKASVILTGPERNFDLIRENMVISLDMSNLGPGKQTIVLTENNINEPAQLSIEQIIPQTIEIRGYQLVRRQLPIRVATTGRLPGKLKLVSISAVPENITVYVAKEKLNAITRISTESLDLSAIEESGTYNLNVVIPEYVKLPVSEEESVSITVKVR